MTTKIIETFRRQLPGECRLMEILPRHKTLLAHVKAGGYMWIVLLTTMPGRSCKAWRLMAGEYWSIQPKYGNRDRFIRENYRPVIESACNPELPQQRSLFQP